MHDFLTISARQERVRSFLDRLGATPPQVLLLEGGRDPERQALALYWACRLNCARTLGSPDQPNQTSLLAPNVQLKTKPCGACPECIQILEQVHRDLVFIDGRTESIKIDMVRELRSLLGEPPRGQGKRVIVLCEAQALQPEAANFLLKSMEEPRPGNVFVLTAPQRERLLPTLVSRSFVLTLTWPAAWDAEAAVNDGEDPAEWAGAMGEFWRTGRGWFERTSDKGRLDANLAARVLVECQRSLAGALSGREDFGQSLRNLGPESLRRLDAALDMAQECLEYRVNPALTLDWLAVTGFSLARGQ